MATSRIPLLGALAALALLGDPVHAQGTPSVGELHPPLRLPTIEGETLDLRELHGQKFLLIEFASW